MELYIKHPKNNAQFELGEADEKTSHPDWEKERNRIKLQKFRTKLYLKCEYGV